MCDSQTRIDVAKGMARIGYLPMFFSYENVFVQRFVWVCMLYARNNTLSQILAHFYQYAGVYVKCGIMEIHNLNRQKS